MLFAFIPRHSNGDPCDEDCISKAMKNAQASGVAVSSCVKKKWAPAGYARNDGGPDFHAWLMSQCLELCKSDKSGAWWTVVKSSDVTKRDKARIAINARNKFAYQ